MIIEELRKEAEKKGMAIPFVINEELIQEDDNSIPGYFKCTVWEDGSITTERFISDNGEVFDEVDDFDVSAEEEIPPALKETEVKI